MTETLTRTPAGVEPVTAGSPDPARPRATRNRANSVVIWIGVTWLVLVLVGSLCADWLAPFEPLKQDLMNSLQGPSGTHWLGTDQLGRDVLSRLMHGGSDAVFGVVIAIVVAIVLGVPFGLLAGYRGGWIDAVTSRVSDVLMIIPGIVLLLTVVAVVGNSLTWAMITLGVLLSAGFFRLARGSAAEVRTRMFIDASRVAGLSDTKVMVVHVLPNIARPIVVQATLGASVALLVQSGLGFIGLGPQPPAPTWGGMVFEASNLLNQSAWMMVPTGGAIVLTALAFNLIGDALTGEQAQRPVRTHFASRRTDQAAYTPSALLEVRNLRLEVNHPAGNYPVVTDVSFTVDEGETVAIVGESGCGKTLTALSLLHLLPAAIGIAEGEVWFDGTDLTKLDDKALAKHRGSGIALISQEPGTALDPAFTVGSQIGECVRRHTQMRRSETRRRVIELLTSVGIARPESVVRSYPHQLSGGMAQRVAIAMALAGSPRLLVADEPTTALDVTVQAELLDLLRQLQTRTGMAIVLVTHDWGVVADIADRAIVMYAGQVVEESSVEHAFDAPAHPYTIGLLASTPSADHIGGRLPTIEGTVPAPLLWPVGCRFQDRCPYVIDDCRSAPIDLVEFDGHRARCIRVPVEVSP